MSLGEIAACKMPYPQLRSRLECICNGEGGVDTECVAPELQRVETRCIEDHLGYPLS